MEGAPGRVSRGRAPEISAQGRRRRLQGHAAAETSARADPTAKDWPKPKPKPKRKAKQTPTPKPKPRARPSWKRGSRAEAPVSDRGSGRTEFPRGTGEAPAGRWRPRSESTAWRGGHPARGVPLGIRARRDPQVSASGCSSSCVGSLSRCRCCSRRELSQLGRRSSGGGPNAFFRPRDGSAILLDLPPPFAGRPRGTDAERPGQHGQRSDDEQREGRDRQVENQSHGARRVADRSFSGRSAWAAPRCR